MARPKTHDEALRRTLLNRAARLVYENGPSALSLRKLASAANTSTTAVYSLFGNKAGLFDAIYREAAWRFAAGLSSVRESGDAAEDVIRLGIAYRDYAMANPNLYTITFAGWPEVPAQRKEEIAATFQPLLDVVRRGVADGRFTEAPAERIALSCWALAHGLVSIELTGNIPPGIDAGAEYEHALRAHVGGWLEPVTTAS